MTIHLEQMRLLAAHFASDGDTLSQASIGTTARHWPARMRRREASEYLLQVHGIRLAPTTMAKLATLGGGPKYLLDGRFPLYPQPELDSFAVARLGSLRASTSDLGQAIAVEHA
jgi:hypothetical protein